MSKITVNGKVYNIPKTAGQGSLVINGDGVFVNGKPLADFSKLEAKEISVTITGDVHKVENCDTVQVNGNVHEVESVSGDVQVHGVIHGDVETISGHIKAGTINGDCQTVSGNITGINKKES